MTSKKSFSFLILLGLLSFADCDDHVGCQNCTSEQRISQFENTFLRFLVTDPEKQGGSFSRLDSLTNRITEFKSCDVHDYSTLNDTKIIKANGEIYKPCEGSDKNYIKIESYSVVDYCTPSFEIKSGQFVLQNAWQIFSIVTPDTILYVPCEAYPKGANLNMNENVVLGYTSANDFGGHVIISPPNQIRFEDVVIGLFVGTEAEIRFEEYLFALLAPNTNTTLDYKIENNVLTVTNPINSYSLKLIAP